MTENASRALEHALVHEVPFKPGKTLFINPQKPIKVEGHVVAFQPFRPWNNTLKSSTNWLIEHEWGALGNSYDTAILLLPKQKDQARGHLAKAFKLLKSGGMIICALDNKAGAGSLAKQHDQATSFSKHKSRVLWAQRDDFINEDICDLWINEAKARLQEEGELKAAPGMFSWRKPDLGSKMLLETLPDKLEGKGADFCSGYGFLSHQILKTDMAEHMTCLEADDEALQLSKENLTGLKVDFEWIDLVSEQPKQAPFDWIVMNPPFHEDLDEDKGLGRACIERAAKSLSKKGVLYMVANQHLPYEKVLAQYFTSVEKQEEKNGFKIFKAVL